MASKPLSPLQIFALILTFSTAFSKVIQIPNPAHTPQSDVDSPARAQPISDQKSLRVGGARPISDPRDPNVVKAAVFAVVEHNRLAKANLKFQSVINGTVQDFGGQMYRLVISAFDGSDGPGNYLARVYYKPWQQLKVLISFEKSVPI
ncbi:Cysteine proteinase inhibitor 5 [Striga hermonthica]|uniref:Cysteine proteinase inhibitor 5 n=1 Tax=Striga hermonthica TaxID=68872 RepID=A0A9N7RE01_STRHE|nr:Cysteine proteinase inhibitor 5 [Striga hermonthica]